MVGYLARPLLYDLYCGECGNPDSIDSASNYSHAESIARAMGWQKRSRWGWTCPKCIENLQQETNPHDK